MEKQKLHAPTSGAPRRFQVTLPDLEASVVSGAAVVSGRAVSFPCRTCILRARAGVRSAHDRQACPCKASRTAAPQLNSASPPRCGRACLGQQRPLPTRKPLRLSFGGGDSAGRTGEVLNLICNVLNAQPCRSQNRPSLVRRVTLIKQFSAF